MGSESQGAASSIDRLPTVLATEPQPEPISSPSPSPQTPQSETSRSSTTLNEANESSPEDMEEKASTTTRPEADGEAPKIGPHRFSRTAKKLMVILLSCAAMFSPLASSIYFPATKAIANVRPSPLSAKTKAVGLMLTCCEGPPCQLRQSALDYHDFHVPARHRPQLLGAPCRRQRAKNHFHWHLRRLSCGKRRPGHFERLCQSDGMARAPGHRKRCYNTHRYGTSRANPRMDRDTEANHLPVGSGAISDITSRAEIGGFIGIFSGSKYCPAAHIG